MSSEVRLLYITTPSIQLARQIAGNLIESKLIACANIIPQMESVYMWEGKLCQDQENILIVKTIQSRVAEVTRKVEELHSFDCPCVVSLTVDGGHQPFLDWVKDESKTS